MPFSQSSSTHMINGRYKKRKDFIFEVTGNRGRGEVTVNATESNELLEKMDIMVNMMDFNNEITSM